MHEFEGNRILVMNLDAFAGRADWPHTEIPISTKGAGTVCFDGLGLSHGDIKLNGQNFSAGS